MLDVPIPDELPENLLELEPLLELELPNLGRLLLLLLLLLLVDPPKTMASPLFLWPLAPRMRSPSDRAPTITADENILLRCMLYLIFPLRAAVTQLQTLVFVS